jgi:hypothetical protein
LEVKYRWLFKIEFKGLIMVKTKRCKSCICWEAIPVSPGATKIGYCTRHPPGERTLKPTSAKLYKDLWPSQTEADEGCWEHIPKHGQGKKEQTETREKAAQTDKNDAQ